MAEEFRKIMTLTNQTVYFQSNFLMHINAFVWSVNPIKLRVENVAIFSTYLFDDTILFFGVLYPFNPLCINKKNLSNINR